MLHKILEIIILRGGQGITPQSQYMRPTHTMEVYGSGQDFNVSHLNRVRPENYVPNTLYSQRHRIFWETTLHTK